MKIAGKPRTFRKYWFSFFTGAFWFFSALGLIISLFWHSLFFEENSSPASVPETYQERNLGSTKMGIFEEKK